MKLNVEFRCTCAPCSCLTNNSGGLELLFNRQKQHTITLQDKNTILLSDLLQYLKDNLLKERPELFLQNKTVYAYYFFIDLYSLLQTTWHSGNGKRDGLGAARKAILRSTRWRLAGIHFYLAWRIVLLALWTGALSNDTILRLFNYALYQQWPASALAWLLRIRTMPDLGCGRW